MKTKHTIEEMNKVIGLWMGYKPTKHPDMLKWVNEDKTYHNEDISDLKFHTSWDYLMQVIGKIQDTLNLSDLIETMDYLWTNFEHGQGEQILEIHATVYQFIIKTTTS